MIFAICVTLVGVLLATFKNTHGGTSIGDAVHNALKTCKTYGTAQAARSLDKDLPLKVLDFKEFRNMTTFVFIPTGGETNIFKTVTAALGLRSWQEALIILLTDVLVRFGHLRMLPPDLPLNLIGVPADYRPDSSTTLWRWQGDKFSREYQYLLSKIFQNSTWDYVLDLFGGALGDFAPFKVADNEIVNDANPKLQNAYWVLRDYPDQLYNKLASLDPYNVDDYYSAQICVKSSHTFPDIDLAAASIFLWLNTVRQCGYGFQPLASYKTRIQAVKTLGARLKGVTIECDDAIKIIQKYKYTFDESTLIMADSPYVDTKGYNTGQTACVKTYDFNAHEQLRNELVEAPHNWADFMFFCRLTDKNHVLSRALEQKIALLYANNYLLYADIELGDGHIDRVITSYEFEDAEIFNV